jgi:hypothetical protein
MRPEDDFSRALAPRARLALAWEIVRIYFGVRLQLRRRPLPDVLERLRAATAQAAPTHPAAPARLARATETVLGRLPADSRCLVRSLVLVRLLARRSMATTLVIGVRPGERFAAHAWVELDGQALLADGQPEYERLTEL